MAKGKERILKAAREKQRVTYERISIRLSADFSAENLQVRRQWHDIFKVMKGEKKCNLGYSTHQDYHSELKER